MKKLVIAIMTVALAGVAAADMYAAMAAGFGIYGNGSEGGIVEDVIGTEIVLQVIAGGGDGLQSGVDYDPIAGLFVLGANDTMLATFSTTIDSTGAYQDYASLLGGTVGGPGTALVVDTWVRVSGVGQDDWVWQAPITFLDADYSGIGAQPEGVNYDYDNGNSQTGNHIGDTTDGSLTVQVIPEPATFGLMGIAGLGLFLARKKARR